MQQIAPLADFYLFGSITTNSDSVSDIDLLVVYPEDLDLHDVKHRLDKIGHYLPLDITYMTAEEEAELDFIKGQGAISIIDSELTSCLSE